AAQNMIVQSIFVIEREQPAVTAGIERKVPHAVVPDADLLRLLVGTRRPIKRRARRWIDRLPPRNQHLHLIVVGDSRHRPAAARCRERRKVHQPATRLAAPFSGGKRERRRRREESRRSELETSAKHLAPAVQRSENAAERPIVGRVARTHSMVLHRSSPECDESSGRDGYYRC